MNPPNSSELIKQMAEENNGHCDRCGQTIKIYRYGLNESHARFMQHMADKVRDTGVNKVDISTIDLPYSIRSQVTKLRLHGLIARVKDERGVQIPRHWLITKKGHAFLHGDPIPAKVITFNNQVLGHEPATTTILGILKGRKPVEPPEEEAITPAQSSVYNDVRTPKPSFTVRAVNVNRNNSNFNKVCELVVGQLVVGQPVTVLKINGREVNIKYDSIAHFHNEWKITTREA